MPSTFLVFVSTLQPVEVLTTHFFIYIGQNEVKSQKWGRGEQLSFYVPALSHLNLTHASLEALVMPLKGCKYFIKYNKRADTIQRLI